MKCLSVVRESGRLFRCVEVALLAGRVLLRDWLVSLCCWAESGSRQRRRATADSRACRSDARELFSAERKKKKTNLKSQNDYRSFKMQNESNRIKVSTASPAIIVFYLF